jgi:ATP-dependent Clp protease ATP-binding subunit ClpA
MFERFTEKAIKVIMLAQEEARRLGHNFVGAEFIFLGLIGEATGVAAKVLRLFVTLYAKSTDKMPR